MLKSQNGLFILDQITTESTDQNNLVLIEQHFCSDGHDFERDAKFTSIERMKTYINVESIIDF